MPSAERRAPVQGYEAGIPWPVHLEAWDAYAKRYGSRQSAERMAERGGFHTNELDQFIPGWRERVSYIATLEARIKELEAASLAPVSPQPVAVDGWPPLKLALWHVVTSERLNAKYVDAWDLTGKLYAAALAHPDDAKAEQRGRLAGIEEAAKVAEGEVEHHRALERAPVKHVQEMTATAAAWRAKAEQRVATKIRALAQPQESSL